MATTTTQANNVAGTMSTRRSFLRILGIGAVAVPAVAVAKAPPQPVDITLAPLSPSLIARLKRNIARAEVSSRRAQALFFSNQYRMLRDVDEECERFANG